ncbi:hypothetical protein C8R44DRAFT_159051 [Mycena epipterygia]|nr:hypothetical protein C8R44DRAFT_159051 [Mycena epipterygia]
MADLDSDSHVNAQLVNAFLGLQLGGGLGLSIIVLTALGSRNVKRNSTWYTFCLAWILSCISYTFIFLVGQQNSPNFGVCVTQAAGIYSAPSTACATLAFAIDMLVGVRAAAATIPEKRRYSITLALLIVPFLVWVVMFVGMLVFAVNNPALVAIGPNGTYCDLKSFTPAKISGLIVVSVTLFTLLIEGYIAARLVRNRKLLEDSQLTRMAVRVMIFSLLGALGLGCGVSSNFFSNIADHSFLRVGVAYVLYSKQGPSFDLLLAFLPACGVIIFGTHMDLVNVWLFWRHPRNKASEIDDLKSPSIYLPTPRIER